ncbi:MULTISPECIES: hypothetical protein [Sinorhizobium]|uniref:Uncharacterized protein n=3 Tax=Sinorhizobium TaxID=28105 RepID=A0A2S3YJY5_9HYPH|nr:MULTISPECIES: hypothetical protein [Sinorhizobium]AUX79852.1 hypothetical protein NXT3_PC00691 [Sinorhizobium fredii]PDT41468.1 hypothetical protein CO656_11750 [Sinorhizobium sp. FG01]PDT53280.1 hypothetical protein CO664_13275 [Sinorhizobium sp. NG07B]POH27671.1 hypothetical protein ATY31_21520 [Sinorhizobium americanum]POH29444.1 hypothetical protein ATY30_17720 [Sinorhizobium americanum]
MTPKRFAECLASLRWTTIDLTSALQCQLAWIEAMESGQAEIPEDLACWLESLAKFHEAAGIPIRYRDLAQF